VSNDIKQYIPDELLTELQQIAVMTRKNRWAVGDITNLIVSVAKTLDLEVMPVYNQIAVWMNEEFSARTIRYYASVSAFFDQPTRYEFDELPYTLFARAMLYGPRWRELLEASMREMGKIGHPPTESWLICHAGLPDVQMSQEPAVPYRDHLDNNTDWFSVIEDLRKGIPQALPEMIRDRIVRLIEEILTLIKQPIDK
jgi:hypothetical protein